LLADVDQGWVRDVVIQGHDITGTYNAGKPVIIPEGILQADAIGPEQKCCISHPRELADALLHLAAEYPRYRAAARVAAPLWRKQHSPEALLSVMLRAEERR
jgi:hypothetical protein